MSSSEQARQALQTSRIIWPVMIGVAAVLLLFYYQFDARQFAEIKWNGHAWTWIGLSFLLLLLRHLFYSLRLRTVSGRFFSWWKSIQLMAIWEFSTSLTPTGKGGAVVMLFVLTREKLSAGRAAAAVFYTTLCDSGFFVLTVPFWLWLYGPNMLFPNSTSFSDIKLASATFFTTWLLMAGYWLVMLVLLVIRPQAAHWVLAKLATWPLLRRFSGKITEWGREFELGAIEIRRFSRADHFRIILATVGVWTCKFIMINCLMVAVMPEIPLDGNTQVLIYARLVAMFVIMAFAPTPGASGIAETLLPQFISDYVPVGIGLVVALLWRSMAYYGYLLAGALILPKWWKRE